MHIEREETRMTVEEKKAQYEIVKDGFYSDYTVINRHTDYCPFVVCWNFDIETYQWDQGHYYNDEASAMCEFYQKEKEAIDEILETEYLDLPDSEEGE